MKQPALLHPFPGTRETIEYLSYQIKKSEGNAELIEVLPSKEHPGAETNP